MSLAPERTIPTDPFAVKTLSKLNAYRVVFTLRGRLLEISSRKRYLQFELPEMVLPDLPAPPEADYFETAVTPVQMQHLGAACRATEHLTGTCIVEVGSWKGVTTRVLSACTERMVYAVDPYFPSGEHSVALDAFEKRAAGCRNITLIRNTSGGASRTWQYGPVSMIFIDAVHDYINTRFDIATWSRFLVPGGILALHDTDQRCFAGTRRATAELKNTYELFGHPDNLTLFRKT